MSEKMSCVAVDNVYFPISNTYVLLKYPCGATVTIRELRVKVKDSMRSPGVEICWVDIVQSRYKSK